MGAKDMEALRRNLLLAPASKVRVTFEPSVDGDNFVPQPKLECTSCDDLLSWDESKGWWSCPECEYELTPEETLLLAEKVKAGLKALVADAKLKRRGSGRWSFLARLLGLGRRSSP